MGPARDIVVISSDEEEEEAPVARRRNLNVDGVPPGLGFFVKLFADRLAISRKLPAVAPPQKKGKPDCFGVGGDDDEDDDDDCVVLDGDPDRPAVTVKAEKGGTAGFVSSDELEIVAEKGKVACRDFPHSRHSCSNLPFSTTSHMEHCSMCYCFVCDTPAPCNYWGKGLSIDDHCHATDKETKWKTLRQESRCNTLPASRPENNQNVVYPTTPSPGQQDIQSQVSVPQSQPSLISDISLFSVAGRDPLLSYARHDAVRVALNAEQTVSAPGAPPAARAESDTRNAQTAQITHPVTEPGASEGTNPPEPYQPEDYYGEYIEPHEEAQVYVGNLPYDVDSEYLAQLFEYAGVVEDSEIVYDRETDKSRGYGFVTMSTVEEAEKAVDIFHDSNLDGRLMIVYKQAAPHRGARAETPPGQSGSSSFRIYVCNLPRKKDDSWLEELFSEYGEVVDAEIVWEYRRKTRRSRGYGFVTMATKEGRECAIAALNRQIFEGRILQVKVAKEQRPRRGSQR